jgi:hypothetical protein
VRLSRASPPVSVGRLSKNSPAGASLALPPVLSVAPRRLPLDAVARCLVPVSPRRASGSRCGSGGSQRPRRGPFPPQLLPILTHRSRTRSRIGPRPSSTCALIWAGRRAAGAAPRRPQSWPVPMPLEQKNSPVPSGQGNPWWCARASVFAAARTPPVTLDRCLMTSAE